MSSSDRQGVRQRHTPWPAVQWLLLAVLAVTALVLGHVGHIRYFDGLGKTRSFFDLVYLDIRLFAFSTAVDPPLPWELQVARYLAPLVGGFSALKAMATLFRDRLDQVHQLVVRDHVIVVGAGDKGRTVATALLDAGQRVVVVEQEPSLADITVLRAHGAVVTHGDGRDRKILELAGVQRARAVIVLCGDDGINAEIAARVQQTASERLRRELVCIAHIVDPELCQLLRLRELEEQAVRGADGLVLDFLNVDLAAAHDIALGYLPHPKGDVVVVVGATPLAARLITALHHRAGAESCLRVVVVDPHATEVIARYRDHHPDAEQWDLIPVDAGAVTAVADAGSVSNAYVCGGDDGQVLETALQLDHLLCPSARITAVFAHPDGLASLARSIEHTSARRMRPYVLLDLLASPEVLRPWTIEALARAAHDSYRAARAKAGDRDVRDLVMRSWEDLPEFIRESNRAQARSIVAKLRRVGAVVIPDDGGPRDRFAFTSDELELLARDEHRRWCDERTADGWTQGERDPLTKRTPYLVGWEALPESVREYDREAVRAIPALLAAAGFRAARSPVESPGSNTATAARQVGEERGAA